jgi:hypothetical protein
MIYIYITFFFVSKVFLTKKMKKGGHHDILETFSKYNDKEHQNSKYLIHYSFKFYKHG